MAVNCWVLPETTLTVAGATVMLVSVWFTVTLTLLVVKSPPALVIVARNA